jgi:hypothetical protein
VMTRIPVWIQGGLAGLFLQFVGGAPTWVCLIVAVVWTLYFTLAPVRARKLALQERELELAEMTLALRKAEMEQAARAAARAVRLQEIEAKQAYWARVTEEEARARRN